MENMRVRRLRELLAETFGGSQTELSRRTGVSLAQLGQYFSGYRNMGEKVARRIENGAGKPAGWLDTDASSPPLLTEEERLHFAAWRTASEEAKEVARFALSDTHAPLPAWADKDMRRDINSMRYAALCWLREDRQKQAPEPKKIAAQAGAG